MRNVGYIFFLILFFSSATVGLGEVEPKIFSIEPTAQKPGETILIRGRNLPMVISVKFDSHESPLINPISNEELEVMVPLPNSTTQSGPWKITALNFETAFGPMSISDKPIVILKSNPPPKIISVVPSHGSRKGGTEVRIFGKGFHKKSIVKLGGVPCTVTRWRGPGELTCKTPPHRAGSIEITAENPDSQNSRLKNGFFYSWAQHFGLEETFSEGTQIVSDKQGNFYVAGNSSYNSQDGESSETTKGFLLKLSPDGTSHWNVSLGEENQASFIKSITLTMDNQILIAGHQKASSGNQAFISKYSAQGKLIWSQPLLKMKKSETLAGSSFIEQILSDKTGNIYIVGSTDIDLQDKMPISGWRAFMAKLDSNGTMLWSHHEGRPDSSGYHLVLGKTAVLDSKEDLILGGVAITQLNDDNGSTTGPLFISKYHVQGSEPPNRLWLKKINEVPNSTPHTLDTVSISLSQQNEAVVLTRYQPLNTLENQTRFYSLNKLSASGEIVFGKNKYDFFENVELEKPIVDSKENIFLIGKSFKKCSDNTSHNGSDIFIAKLDKSGKKRWQQSKETLASTTASAAIIHDGELYVTGSVQGDLEDQTTIGLRDILVSRYTLDGEAQ